MKYDPRKWNRWPEVEPPSCELMRFKDFDVETEPGKRFGKTIKVHAWRAVFWNDGLSTWMTPEGKRVRIKGNTVIFRPWVGPDEKEDKE